MASEFPPDDIRQTQALDAELISDPDDKIVAEGRNGLRQIDAVTEMVEYYVHSGLRFKLRVSNILHLHRIALDGISSYAGNFRPAGVEILGSKHQPIGAHLAAEYLEHLCDYVNEHMEDATALHLSAYVLWRLNPDSSVHGW